METVKNKVAVVTGAGSGIGEAIAREAAARGMSVVVADIDEAAAERVAHVRPLAGRGVLRVLRRGLSRLGAACARVEIPMAAGNGL